MEDTRDNSDHTLANYSSRVQAVVDFSGPPDFTAMHDPERIAFLTQFLNADYAKSPQAWRKCLARLPRCKDRRAIPHPAWHSGSKCLYEAERVIRKLQAAGVPVSLIKVNDVHTFRTPEARRQLAIETLEFFNHDLMAGK